MSNYGVNPVVAAAVAAFATFIYPAAVHGDGGTLLEALLHSNPICAPVLAAAAKHEVQVLYTQIDRDADNRPHFTRHDTASVRRIISIRPVRSS